MGRSSEREGRKVDHSVERTAEGQAQRVLGSHCVEVKEKFAKETIIHTR